MTSALPPSGFSQFQQRYHTENGNANIELVQKQKQELLAEQAATIRTKAAKGAEVLQAVEKDIAVGIAEVPRSVYRGVAGAVNNLLEYVYDAADIATNPVSLAADIATSIKYPQLEKSKDSNGPKLPLPQEADSVTGKVVESISQFVTGFGAAGKALNALKSAPGLVGQAAASIQSSGFVGATVKGTLGDLLAFGSQEERLSNVIQQVPALQNPVTDFLAASPDDGEVEGRLKQAIEGMALGGIGETLFRGIRALRNGKQAYQQAIDNGVADDVLKDAMRPKESVLGDEANTELLITRKVMRPAPDLTPDDIAAGAARAPQPEDEIRINFAAVQGPEDIKRLMQSLANDPKLIEGVQKARRGVVSDIQLRKEADTINAFDVLMTRRVGQPFSAAEALAAKELYNQSTIRVAEAAAVASRGGPDQIFDFQKMVTIHRAVQEEFLGGRAELGRALRALSLPVEITDRRRIKAVENALRQFGDPEQIRKLANEIATMNESGLLDAEKLDLMIRPPTSQRVIGAIVELRNQALLTSPRTHILNFVSGQTALLEMGIERAMMAASPESGVKANEVMAFFNGWIGSYKAALVNAGKALRQADSSFLDYASSGSSQKYDQGRVRATSREVLDPDGTMGIFSKSVDALGYFFERYVGGQLAFGDAFNRTNAATAHLYSLATREGNRKGLTGDALADFVQKTIQAPPEAMQEAADEFGKTITFMTQLGNAGQKAIQLRAQYPALGLVIPFITAPANIFKFTFGRTPLGFLSKTVQEDLRAGGSRRAARLAGIGLGTSTMMLGADLAMNGHMTGSGPSDDAALRKLRDAGWQPYSVKIGDRYIEAWKLGPVGAWLVMGATMTEIMGNYDSYDMQSEEEIKKLSVAMITAMSDVVLEQSFMTGLSDLINVLNDPERYGENYFEALAGSFVPSLVADIEKAFSPEVEEVLNMADAVKARIPGLSGSVAKRRNVYGELINSYYPDPDNKFMATVESIGRVFNPIRFSDDDRPSNKISEYFLVHGLKGVSMPNKVQQFQSFDFGGQGSVSIDLSEYPQIWDRFMELRGTIVPDGLYAPLKDYLIDAVNNNNELSTVLLDKFATNDVKDSAISQLVSYYDKAAREQLLNEFPVLQQEISKEVAKQQPTDTSTFIRTRPLP